MTAKKPEWSQGNPRDQVVLLISGVQGHLLNLEMGIPLSMKTVEQLNIWLRSAQEILRTMPEGKWSKTAGPWQMLKGPGETHCACRVSPPGADPSDLKNRVAFIEKTPRIRVVPYLSENDSACWRAVGPKGDGFLCGKDPESRAACDRALKELGYELED